MAMGLLAGMAFIAVPVLGWDFRYFPGDLADGRFNLYLLEHAYRYITGRVDYFWGAPFMFPEANVISYSDNLLGSAPIYALFRLVGLSDFSAYQGWFLTVAALNYAAAYYFLHYVCKNRYAAALGAFVFAFSLALQSQMPHAQTFPRYAVPLALWALVKFGESFRPRYFFLAVLMVVYQVYCGIYLGFMLVVPVGLVLILLAWNGRELIVQKIKSVRWWLKMVFSVGVGVAVLLPLMLPYIRRGENVVKSGYEQIVLTLPRLSDYLFAIDGSPWWFVLQDTGKDHPYWWDLQLFAGGVATLCMAVAAAWVVWRWAKNRFDVAALSQAQTLLLAGVFTFVLFLRVGPDISAYYLLYQLPGFDALRSLGRIINVEILFFGLAVAWIFARIVPDVRGIRSFGLFLGALALLTLDNYLPSESMPHTPVAASTGRTAPLDSIFSSLPEGTVVSYEPDSLQGLPIYAHIDAMLLTQKHGLIAVNGYSATSPPRFDRYWRSPDADTRNFWLAGKLSVVDTLYVVRSPSRLERVSTRDIEVRRIMNYIRSDEAWMESIRSKAADRGIPVDSMLRLDAQWTLEHP